ncbi:MAG: hypothetical protein RDU20_00590 [Desulfomonilaceae bacterium]|nr:hypothetical protein [Desulfomonilaceae bacterium]
MNEKIQKGMNVEALAEQLYVKPVTSLDECYCSEEHRLSIALSEQRGRPELFWPDRKGIAGAYCATHNRRCGT